MLMCFFLHTKFNLSEKSLSVNPHFSVLDGAQLKQLLFAREERGPVKKQKFREKEQQIKNGKQMYPKCTSKWWVPLSLQDTNRSLEELLTKSDEWSYFLFVCLFRWIFVVRTQKEKYKIKRTTGGKKKKEKSMMVMMVMMMTTKKRVTQAVGKKKNSFLSWRKEKVAKGLLVQLYFGVLCVQHKHTDTASAIATSDAVVVADVMLSLGPLLNDAYSFCGSSVKGCPVSWIKGKKEKTDKRNSQSVSQWKDESSKGCLY